MIIRRVYPSKWSMNSRFPLWKSLISLMRGRPGQKLVQRWNIVRFVLSRVGSIFPQVDSFSLGRWKGRHLTRCKHMTTMYPPLIILRIPPLSIPSAYAAEKSQFTKRRNLTRCKHMITMYPINKIENFPLESSSWRTNVIVLTYYSSSERRCIQHWWPQYRNPQKISLHLHEQIVLWHG